MSPKIVRELKKWATVCIEIRGDSRGTGPTVVRAVDDFRSGARVELEGAAFISQPLIVGSSVFVLVDSKGMTGRQADAFLGSITSSLAAAGIDGELGLASGVPDFVELHEVDNAISLAFMPVAHAPKGQPSRVRALAATLLAAMQDIVALESPALRVGIDVPVSWDFLLSYADAAGPDLPMRCIAGDRDLYAELLMMPFGDGHLLVGGASLGDDAILGASAARLRQAGTDIDGPPSGTIISLGRTPRDVATGPRPHDLLGQIDDRYLAPDRFAVGVGWSQTMPRLLWDRIQQESSDGELRATVRDVDADRVEVTFGLPHEWAPWLGAESPTRQRAQALFEPTLIGYDEWMEVTREILGF